MPRQALHLLEHRLQLATEPHGLLAGIGIRCQPAGGAEHHVDRPAAGGLGWRPDTTDPLGPPGHQGDDRCAGLGREGRRARHQGADRERRADAGLGEDPDDLTGLEVSASAQVGVRRSRPVDRYVTHRVHRPGDQPPRPGWLPHVVATEEAEVATLPTCRELREREVDERRVRHHHDRRTGRREVLGAVHGDAQAEGGDGGAPDQVHAGVHGFHGHPLGW